MSKNEKKTENLARKLLSRVGIFDNTNFIVEEQKSDNPVIQKLLKNASKSGAGLGKPEFIIRKKDDNDFLMVIECKADIKYHESKNRDIYKDFAVDGTLLYGSHLSKEFNVIAIGISGESEGDLKISTFLYAKKSLTYTDLLDENNQKIKEILNWDRYIDRAKFDPVLAKSRHSDLMRFSRDLHDYMRDYAKITEAQKPLLVSGVLLALMDRGFEVAYNKYEGEELANETFNSIKKIIEKSELGDTHETKKKAVTNAFSFIAHHPELQKVDPKRNESPLLHIVRDLHVHVQPFTKDHYDFDIIGNFYGEFIRYTGGDGKGLGIVLTPKQITDLFADLAKLDKNSIVLDICAGTGGFLISAMKKMTERVSAEEKRRILSNSLIGIEQEPQMFALAVSNMILRGDGKTNLYQGSCFDDSLFNKIKGKANAGFMNPPYSQKGDNLHEWDFIIRMLNGLSKNATGIAIVPISVAIDTRHPLREKLLSEHRLEAVMSMPNELFYPAGTVTCIMVFTAHTPHDSDKHHESWFGYWKDDGFRKDKVQGRIPRSNELWNSIKNKWITDFTNKKDISGISIRKKVKREDEWCVEAYLETDFSDISAIDFTKTVHDFVGFKFSTKKISEIFKKSISSSKKDLRDRKWKYFCYEDIFSKNLRGRRLIADNRIKGEVLYFSASEFNNGLTDKIENPLFIEKNSIIYTTFGDAFYVDGEFTASDEISIFNDGRLNVYNGLFIVTLMMKNKYKYSFGRKAFKNKWSGDKISIPVDKNGNPDWQFMEDYIKSLPYSASI
ncbi:MAG: N-6 DNA methylase [Candidatus Nomurabacteria bacterium GW2011_GWA2_40_9]|uniref:site-specific DNA-methyltransferase (adenine-specific) n=1 Tax=Candidatus Nomurabacteria bacterium GW2011_GWA2_40_9 TaxID=1618734 RepID=A0A0G0TXD0_9BACT|nr:MAG: N-6 DNA methylase [Candidatus Nomurabacteria bacterium GW2011_GWA2_40_9]